MYYETLSHLLLNVPIAHFLRMTFIYHYPFVAISNIPLSRARVKAKTLLVDGSTQKRGTSSMVL